MRETLQSGVDVVTIKLEVVEERVDKLELMFERHLEQDANAHRQLEASMSAAIDSQTKTNTKLDELIGVLKEPLEDFNTRKYGMKFVKSFATDTKVWVALVAATLVVMTIYNPGLAVKLIGAVFGG